VKEGAIIAFPTQAVQLSCNTATRQMSRFLLSNVLFQYEGADDIRKNNAVIKFKVMDTGETLESASKLRTSTPFLYDGTTYYFKSASDFNQDFNQDDYAIQLFAPCDRDLSCDVVISDEDHFTIGGIEFIYKGADNVHKEGAIMKFQNVETGETIETKPKLTALSSLFYGSVRYHFESVSDYNKDNYMISLFYPCS